MVQNTSKNRIERKTDAPARSVSAKKEKKPIVGKIFKGAIKITSQAAPTVRVFRTKDPVKMQTLQLKKLMTKAADTAFGRRYNFKKLLNSKNLREDFAATVPIYDYDKMYRDWWYRCLCGETFVSWPGKIKYFALSSGTSGAASKYIPVSGEMVRAISKTGKRQFVSFAKYDLPEEMYDKLQALMLGGSTHLQYNGTYYAGDLSGITTGHLPFWFEHFYKPGRRISRERDWPTKIEEIVQKAPQWNIGVVVGVPAWFQILFQKIIERYNLKTIHDIWPNLQVFIHGGVAFEPYKKSFEKLLAHPITYMETYLASEGFLACQFRPDSPMEFVIDNGIFFEFIPFDDENFDANGSVVEHPKTLFLDQIEENKDYAVLISTCSGAWRYMIGDTIRLTNRERNEMVITGRTKLFLSICGEHLSVDNMNRAVQLLGEEKGVGILEYTVIGEKSNGMFGHRWFLGCDQKLDPKEAAEKLDKYLGELNDDYRVERLEAIRSVNVEVLPTEVFYDYMKKQGKEGAQNKFPRVLKGEKAEQWLEYLRTK